MDISRADIYLEIGKARISYFNIARSQKDDYKQILRFVLNEIKRQALNEKGICDKNYIAFRIGDLLKLNLLSTAEEYDRLMRARMFNTMLDAVIKAASDDGEMDSIDHVFYSCEVLGRENIPLFKNGAEYSICVISFANFINWKWICEHPEALTNGKEYDAKNLVIEGE